MYHPYRMTFLYDADADGAGAGAATNHTQMELPDALKNKYVSVDKYNGTKGALEQQRDRYKGDYDKVLGEKDVLGSQLEALNRQLEELKPLAATKAQLEAEVAQRKAEVEAQNARNDRMRTLLKFPELIGEDTLVLVENANLTNETLEQTLSKLAERFKAAGVSAAAVQAQGETQAAPRKTDLKPADLMAEAEALRQKGDLKGFNSKLREAYQLMDATNKFMPPAEKGVLDL